MIKIRDDPVIRTIERSGYPPWFRDEGEDKGGQEDEAGRHACDEQRPDVHLALLPLGLDHDTGIDAALKEERDED